jgi:hypothetical protein
MGGDRRGGGAARDGDQRARHQPGVGLAHRRAVPLRPVDPAGGRADPAADGARDRHRLRARHGARGHAALAEPPAALGQLDLHLDLPVRAADPAAAVLVQPRAALPGDQLRHPVRSRVLLGRHDGSRQPAHRRRAGAGAAPGRLRRGGGAFGVPRRGPGPARGGGCARHPEGPPVPPDPAAAGDAHDPAHRGQRADRAGQGHVGGLHHGAVRALLPGAGDLHPQRAGHPAAARGRHLVPGAHHGDVDRPVLHRAPLRPGSAAQRA